MSKSADQEIIRSWDALRKNILLPGLPENEILKELSDLCDIFISGTGGTRDYATSDETVSAYTLFYLPTNIPKFSFIVNQLPLWFQEELKQCHFIDMGTGPGTYLLAFLAFLEGRAGGNLYGVDRSDRMLRQAKLLIEYFFPGQNNILLLKNLPEIKIPGKKILFFGHSVNELGLKKTLDIIGKVSPDHIFIIEPGTKKVFKDILRLRREITASGYKTLYPCPAEALSCPMESGEDWCHQVLRTSHDAGIERLSQIFSKDRRTMPLISHVYSKTKATLSPGISRVVRRLGETRFSFIREICTGEREDGIVKVEILKKGLSKDQKKGLKNESTGYQIKFEIIKKIDRRYWRVLIKKSDQLTGSPYST